VHRKVRLDDVTTQDTSIGAAGTAAEAFLNSQISGDGTSQSQQPTPSTAQQTAAAPVPTQQQATPTPVSDTPTPLALEDAKTYLWTNPVTGAQEPKTGKEIKAGWMLQSDYTRKTQEAAALRKQLDPYIQEREQVVQLLRDPSQYLQFAQQHLGPQAVQQLIQALAGSQAPQQPQFDPNGIATVGQAQTLAEQIAQQHIASVQQQIAALQQQLQTAVTGAKQELRDEQEVKGYNEQINPVIKAVFDSNPILSVVPNAEESIRWEVLQMQRRGEITNVAQAVQAFRDVGARHASALNTKFQELQKAQLASQHSLVTNGIEPPGGVLVQQHGGGYKAPQRPDGKVDFDGIGRDVEAFIRSANAG
jgi:hypothetical protein